MPLPGLSKEQMVKVDEIMMRDLQVPVEYMMEHAGHNLARLSSRQLPTGQTCLVIAGSGNNGGGGLVSACRLKGWGYDVEVYLPQGRDSLKPVPMKQALRAESLGIKLKDGIPRKLTENLVIDAYLGYGYSKRRNIVTEEVLDFLAELASMISLDIPSGMDSNTGESTTSLSPVATMTIAFVKTGLMKADMTRIGQLYVADIGVPRRIIEEHLGINWNSPYSVSSLHSLYAAFTKDSLQEIIIVKEGDYPFWKVK